jgi:hypothetical protein
MMTLSRRQALLMAATALSPSSATSTTTAPLRLLPLRHTSVLVDIAGRRVLFDPSLSPSFSAQGVFAAPPSARSPDELGPLDLVCVSSGELTSFDPRTVARLDLGRARILVPDDDTAARVRRLGHRRVRVVRAGDTVAVAGLVVHVSPGRGVASDAVGFHIAHADAWSTSTSTSTPTSTSTSTPTTTTAAASIWHTGLVPPLDVDARVAAFAGTHAARVVLGCAWGLRLRAGGPDYAASLDDAITLARLARARVLFPLGASRDAATPTGVFSLVLGRSPPPPEPLPESADLAVRLPLAGTWYRLP